MRKKIIAGNWKMNKGIEASVQLAREVAGLAGPYAQEVDVVVCPTFISLASVCEALKGTGIAAGAQDCYYMKEGAYTGEVNPELIGDAGAQYCIVGHSERRTLMKETDREVNLKVKALLKQGRTPIVCLGETLEERQASDTVNVVCGQVIRALAGVDAKEAKGVVIAYEPVWAIGTGLNATSEDAQAVCSYIRKAVEFVYGRGTADEVRIQYGGSVKADNIEGFMSQPDIDGALVGGASLKAAEFERIVAAAAAVR